LSDIQEAPPIFTGTVTELEVESAGHASARLHSLWRRSRGRATQKSRRDRRAAAAFAAMATMLTADAALRPVNGQRPGAIMGGRYEALYSALTAIAILASTAARGNEPDDFHGLEFQCGRFPGVNIARGKAFWQNAKTNVWTTGTATLGKNSVTVRLPNLPAYTITQRGNEFYSGGKLCQADNP
jgi:hypothetical protein